MRAATFAIRSSLRARAAFLVCLTLMVLGGFQASSQGADVTSADHAAPRGAAGSPSSSRQDGTTTSSLDTTTRDAAAAAGTAKDAQASTQEPAIISTATVALQADDVTAARREIQVLVDRSGGRVAESSSESDDTGRAASVRMVLRVPASSFDAALEGLGGVGTQTSQDQNESDVTTQVIDNAARLATQKASVTRIQQLLAQATTIRDIAWLEAQLSERQATLDSLTQQQAWLKDQTSMSTITVHVSTASDHQADPDEPAFVAGLKSGWNTFVASLSWLATAVGSVLPFAVTLGLVWWVTRRLRRPGPVGFRRPARR